MAKPYVPLHMRSAFSLLSGTVPVEQVVRYLARAGFEAAALTDVNNLYGAVPFAAAMREAGLLPLLGATLDHEEGRAPAAGLRGVGPVPALRGEGRRERPPCSDSPRGAARRCGTAPTTPRDAPVTITDEHREPGRHPSPEGLSEHGGLSRRPSSLRRHAATLLARNRTGYANLGRILTERNLAGLDPEAWGGAFDPAEAIARCQKGLFVLTEDLALAERLAGELDQGRLFLELVRPGRSVTHERRLREAALRLGVELVATSDAYAACGARAREGAFLLHRVFRAIARGSLLGEVPERELPHPDNRVLSPEEMERLFRDAPRALHNTRRIARACELDITSDRPIFPRYPLPPGETPYSHLFRLCSEGLRRRFDTVGPRHLERLTYELDVIQKLGFPEYFVIVGDIVRFARERGIPVVGRGSGASSLVAYLLGITNVDPLAYGLHFERFLNLSRADCPDLDVDLCWRGRDEVIDHVYATYGDDRVAMISTHCTFQPRSAFREVAKVYGVSNDQVNRLSRFIPYRTEEGLAKALENPVTPHRIPLGEEPFRTIVKIATAIEGFPHHLGIHSGGIVIADRPITDYVPLEEATKGIVVTQFEMDAIEAIGLVKIDLLGNRSLSTIRETIRLVREETGETLEPDRFPDRDPETVRILSTGRTLSCFQIESPAMRNLLTQLGTSSLEETIAAISLVRPGPADSGMKEAFIRRAAGAEAPVFLHPSLERVLGDTHGVMLYEEDVMRVACAVAGYTLEEGEVLRRSIAKARTEEERRRAANAFIARAVKNGVEPDAAQRVWEDLGRFAFYAFCKAHASGYGVLAYQSAYLKTHFPAEYFVAVLNNHQGMYPRRAHLEEARRRGVPILYPCVNRSMRETALERVGRRGSATGVRARRGSAGGTEAERGPWDEIERKPGSANGGKAIRIGLGEIKGLGQRSIERILEARARRLLGGLPDLLRRVPLSFREAEALVLAGALDFTGASRPRLLWQLHTCFEEVKTRRGEEEGMFEDTDVVRHPDVEGIEDYDPVTRLRLETRVLELTPGAHPMSVLAPYLRKLPDPRMRRLLPSRRVLARPGGRVLFAGIVSASRRTRTVRGEIMQFLTLEDEEGLVECTLFPDAYRRFAPRLQSLGPYIVEGKVEDQYGARTITVENIEAVTVSAGRKKLQKSAGASVPARRKKQPKSAGASAPAKRQKARAEGKKTRTTVSASGRPRG